MKREKLISHLDKLDSDLKQLLENLKMYSADQLNRKPGPSVWSPLQILYHLYRSETLSLSYVKKKMHYNDQLKNSDWRTLVRSCLLSLALRAPFKYTAAPQVNIEHLPEEITLDIIEKDWLGQRDELRSFLLGVDASFLNKNVYRHPYAGRLGLIQMLQFFGTHFHRHEEQIFNRLGLVTG